MAANLEQILQVTNASYININSNREFYTKHYTKLRDTLYKTIKQEQPLGNWLNGHKLGGSYGDRLKITKPDEFDLVIHLKFPENDRIIVRRDPKLPGNVTLDMTEVLKALATQGHNEVTYTNLKKIVTEKNLLLEDKLQNMIKGAMQRALNKMNNRIEVAGRITTLVYKNCGPAHTIVINEPSFKYSVDFVPAILLNAKQNVLGPDELKFFKNVPSWDAIPKPLKPFEPKNVSFRASYYEAENLMLQNKNRLKDVIKFMKKFRDSKQNMNNLKSYYIKTVLLWQIKEKNPTYWSESQLKDILINMFDHLLKCLHTTGKLQFFWDPKLNLFGSFTQNQRGDMHRCVNSLIRKLKEADGNFSDGVINCVTTSFTKREERDIEAKMQNINLGKPNPKPQTNNQPKCSLKTEEKEQNKNQTPLATTTKIQNLPAPSLKNPSISSVQCGGGQIKKQDSSSCSIA